jgi:hypothetical protein
MTSIAETMHQQDPQAIAEILHTRLQQLDEDGIEVEAEMIDSNLELQIRTNTAIDRQKLLTFIRSELQNLSLESVTKFRIHCWRNDSEMRELRLLWTEQFMLEPLQHLHPHLISTSDAAMGSQPSRFSETQLSKQSVLHQAIKQIAPHHPKAQEHLLESQQAIAAQQEIDLKTKVANLASNSNPISQNNHSFNNASNYWQLLLLGISIVIFGLGIGALVKAITIRQSLPESAAQGVISDARVEPQQSQQSVASPNVSPSVANPSPSAQATELISEPSKISNNVVTLEKFNLIKDGMSVAQVEEIFGVAGKVIAETEDEESVGIVYSWKNPQGSNAIIEFKNGKVVAKAQAGL